MPPPALLTLTVRLAASELLALPPVNWSVPESSKNWMAGEVGAVPKALP